ncbi:hypothetical protein PSZ83_24195, partial [Shigella sonnei]|nr:hypothetical protein [Shigella sonnei]
CSRRSLPAPQHPGISQIRYPVINKFGKVAGYQINFQKWVAFLYTNNEILEKEYENIIPYKITPPKLNT